MIVRFGLGVALRGAFLATDGFVAVFCKDLTAAVPGPPSVSFGVSDLDLDSVAAAAAAAGA